MGRKVTFEKSVHSVHCGPYWLSIAGQIQISLRTPVIKKLFLSPRCYHKYGDQFNLDANNCYMEHGNSPHEVLL